VIIGDPYSPFFVLIGESDPAQGQIARIDYNLGEPSCP
jgi:hypothetical protein